MLHGSGIEAPLPKENALVDEWRGLLATHARVHGALERAMRPLDLGVSAEGTALAVLTVPADAPLASEVSIHLTATADATASIGGFNGARKAFTVRRE